MRKVTLVFGLLAGAIFRFYGCHGLVGKRRDDLTTATSSAMPASSSRCP
jgi:hypothetical protein